MYLERTGKQSTPQISPPLSLSSVISTLYFVRKHHVTHQPSRASPLMSLRGGTLNLPYLLQTAERIYDTCLTHTLLPENMYWYTSYTLFTSELGHWPEAGHTLRDNGWHISLILDPWQYDVNVRSTATGNITGFDTTSGTFHLNCHVLFIPSRHHVSHSKKMNMKGHYKSWLNIKTVHWFIAASYTSRWGISLTNHDVNSYKTLQLNLSFIVLPSVQNERHKCIVWI